MGRGASEDTGSSLLYGRIHRDPEVRLSPRVRADRAFARYLEGALDRAEAAELHAFLCSGAAEDMSRRKVVDADTYANWLSDRIISKTPPSPGIVREHPSLLKDQTHAIGMIARAGASLTPEVRERLIGSTVTSDLICGRGHEIMVENLDKLIRRTNFRRTSHMVVHQQALFGPGDRPSASHYKSSVPDGRVACGRRISSQRMNWSDTDGRRPTCRSCQALGEKNSPKILRREEDTPQLVARRFEAIAEKARTRAATLMSRAPVIDVEQFLDDARREAWVGLALIIAEVCREAGEPLDRGALSRLQRYWSPVGAPEGCPSGMPSVTI